MTTFSVARPALTGVSNNATYAVSKTVWETPMTTVVGELTVTNGGTAGATADAARTNLEVARVASFEGELAPWSTRSITNVQQTTPSAGNSVTMATLTGVGIIEMLQLTTEDNDLSWNGMVEVYVDGETVPSISVDIGTLFLTHNDAHTGTGGAYATKHLQTNPYGSGRTGAFSGGLAFPIPYSSGCIVKLRAPTGSTAAGTGVWYSQIIYRPSATSKYRLRSKGVTWTNKTTHTATQQIVFFDAPQNAGFFVWASLVAQGTTNATYMERCQWVAVDGETETVGTNGIMQTNFVSSGGEDMFLHGWFFGGLSRVSGIPWTIVTCANNGSFTTNAGFDFLSAYGGIKFANQLRFGWSLKDPAFLTSGHSQAWCALYYVDTSVSFVPSAPRSVVAAPGNASLTVTWTAPLSTGSSFLTGYTVTLSPGGATTTVGAGTLTASFSSLTNGTTYTASVVATSSVGNSSAGTGTGTPTSSIWDFTPASLPSGVTATGATNGTRINSSGNVVAATAPRYNFSGGTCQGIWNEAAVTNLSRSFADQSNTTYWTTFASGTGSITITANQGVAPDGNTTAAKVVATRSASAAYAQVHSVFSATSGTSYKGGIWVKAFAGGDVSKVISVGQYNGTGIINCVNVTLTSTWQRVATAATTTQATTASAEFDVGYIDPAGVLDGSATSTQTGTTNFFVWGGQVETGTNLSSDIITTTATVTRTADVITGTVPSGKTSAFITYADASTETIAVTGGTSWTIPNRTKVIATVAFT